MGLLKRLRERGQQLASLDRTDAAVVPLTIDRFLIASLISMTAVGYYTVSYELVSRLSIFPTSIVTTLFPALSCIGANRPQATWQESLRQTK